MLRIFCIISILLLAACSSSKDDSAALLEQAVAPNDPTNEQLVKAINQYLKANGAPLPSRYKYLRYDLNNDRRRDALVMLNNPYTYWCGENGCAMLIFRANDDSFTLINKVQPIRGPMYISPVPTNGWKDLIVRVSGRMSQKARHVAMRYDGQKYPTDPATLPGYYASPASNPSFIRIFYK